MTLLQGIVQNITECHSTAQYFTVQYRITSKSMCQLTAIRASSGMLSCIRKTCTNGLSAAITPFRPIMLGGKQPSPLLKSVSLLCDVGWGNVIEFMWWRGSIIKVIMATEMQVALTAGMAVVKILKGWIRLAIMTNIIKHLGTRILQGHWCDCYHA